jgi:hypothetical protein
MQGRQRGEEDLRRAGRKAGGGGIGREEGRSDRDCIRIEEVWGVGK